MTEFALLGLILGFLYSYINLEEKIRANPVFLFWFRLVGVLIGILAIHQLSMNLSMLML